VITTFSVDSDLGSRKVLITNLEMATSEHLSDALSNLASAFRSTIPFRNIAWKTDILTAPNGLDALPKIDGLAVQFYVLAMLF
jgi:hypothetical protein